MPKYVIERDIPGAGKLSEQELQAISQKSCSVLNKMGPQIQWLQSYVTGDKIYCVRIPPKLDTCSAANWTVVPSQTGHPFQAKLDTLDATARG